MSWRFLIVFIVLCLVSAAIAGAALGSWLVAEAPILPEEVIVQDDGESLVDAKGRTRNGLSPQPLSDGTLGMPVVHEEPAWEIEHVSLFDGQLDPMVSIAMGDRMYTISDVLAEAGFGLEQGEGDVGTVDVTSGQHDGDRRDGDASQAGRPGDQSWQAALEAAVRACDNVGFFSRPGCLDRARRQYCAPNNAWGKHPLCPAQDPIGHIGG